MIDKNTLNGLVVKGAQALGGVAVDGVSGFLRGGMEERDMGEDKLEALDTVTEVSKEMVPDMLGKVAGNLFFSKNEKDVEDKAVEE